jgi:flagellar L-ring protein precursor FlgH
MSLRVYLPAIVSIALLSGCAKSADPDIDFKPPTYVQQMPSQEEIHTNNTGSLYGRGENPLFSDRKAMRVNDVVTVLIDESASASSSGSRQLSRSQESQMGPGVMTYGGSAGWGQNVARELNNVAGFGFTTNSESEFAGSGTANRTENFTTTVSARIVKVMQNGNYFIEGRREILVEGEKQVIQLSGVIRPYDITQNNIVSSANISDAKIAYKTEGQIRQSTQKGWGTRLVEAVWPF